MEGPTKVPIGGSSSCCRNDRQLMTPVRLPGIRELGSQRHLGTLQNCVFFGVIVVDAVLRRRVTLFPVYIVVMCPSGGQEVA